MPIVTLLNGLSFIGLLLWVQEEQLGNLQKQLQVYQRVKNFLRRFRIYN